MVKFPKAIGVLLAVAILAGVAAGCKPGGSGKSNSSGEIKNVSLLVYDRGAMPSSEGTLNENWFTVEFNKRTQSKLGINVTFVTVPNAQREQKLAAMLAAGDAPDLCYTYDQTELMNYSRNGGLVDLGPLVTKYGPDIQKTVGTDQLNQAKIDGKLTRIFSAACLPADDTWFRTDWLEALNMKMPTTVDEFYNYLKALKEKDPGHVGSKLVPFMIPCGGDDPFIRVSNVVLQGFLKTAPTAEKLVTPYQMWPETKDMFRFLNKLYNEGLMGQLVVDKDQSQYKQMLVNGYIGATVNYSKYMYDNAYGNILANLQKNIPTANLVGGYPWKDLSMKEYIYTLFMNGPNSAMTWFVPKSTKDSVADVKLLNYMASDDYITLLCEGIQGKDYNIVDGVAQPIDQTAFNSHVAWLWGAYNALAPMYVNEPDKAEKVIALGYDKKYQEDYIKSNVNGPPAAKYATPVISEDTPVTNSVSANLSTLWAAAEAKIIMAPEAQFDSAYESNLSAWKSTGGTDMTNELLAAYKKQYGK